MQTCGDCFIHLHNAIALQTHRGYSEIITKPINLIEMNSFSLGQRRVYLDSVGKHIGVSSFDGVGTTSRVSIEFRRYRLHLAGREFYS